MTSIRHNSDGPPHRSTDDSYLDAARDAILAVGWSRTTLTDIARRAGVSRMTLYRRWPDTQTLLADLMTREWGDVVTTAARARGDHDSARDRITRGSVAVVQTLRANELLGRIIDVDPEVLLPYLLDRRGRSQQLVTDALAGLVADGQRDGSVRVGDPVTMARSLVLACHGFTLSAHTMADTADPGDGSGDRSGDRSGFRSGNRDADVAHLDAELSHLVESYLAP